MKSTLSLLLVVLTTLSPALVFGQTPSAQDQSEVVRVRTNEVKLDVVVKDKKGRPIKDLKATDFEVSEDGVVQKVESFQFIGGELGTAKPDPKSNEGAPSTSTPQPKAPRTTVGVTALVFDRLSPEARSLARKAGLAYAQEGMAAGDYTGVFGIDLSLQTLQSFTDNTEQVKNAVERATGTATSSSVSPAAKIRENSDRIMVLNQQIDAGASAAVAAGGAQDSAGASAAGAAIGQAATAKKLLEMQNQMSEHYERLEREQEGFATINSLLAVITPMQNLPGRKTIIFFSEGLKLPSAVQQKFPSVINAANRANVSIYAIDAAGLRIESGTAETKREIDSIAAVRTQQQSQGDDRGSSGPYTRALERNEDALRFDPRSGLGPLANETGGFLINNTNDLVAGLRRIDDDMHGYYMLTYVPQNKDYDGRFRLINVKVPRSNVDVQSRKGYYAVESVGQFPLLDYEAPAIAAARKAQGGQTQSAFRGAALSYPVPNRSGLTLVLAEAPMTAFKFAPSNDNKTYSSNFSIVALIRDEAGQVMQKLSQHYTLTGAIADLATAQKGDLLFYREAQLPPGKYRVELIAYDAATRDVKVRSTSLDILAVDDSKPRLSSLSVLKRAERLTPEEQKRDQPFYFGELLVYPNLGEQIDRSTTKQLAFFFTAWPAKGATKPMQLTLEILQNKTPIGKTSGELPAADAQGRIKYASAIPLAKFPNGVFELKITISDGANNVSRSTEFTLSGQ